MIAMIFAIGMSFTTVDAVEEDYATKYVRIDNAWHTIDVTCGTGDDQCEVIFSQDPNATPYEVYNSPSLLNPALGNGQMKIIQGPVPSE